MKCPLCSYVAFPLTEEEEEEKKRLAAEWLIKRRQDARLRFYREKTALEAELRSRGFNVHETQDGSLIIVGCYE
jgi:hypothetical protein